MILVFAGTNEEYATFLLREGLTEQEAIYVVDHETILEHRRGRVVFVGSYLRRVDFDATMELVFAAGLPVRFE